MGSIFRPRVPDCGELPPVCEVLVMDDGSVLVDGDSADRHLGHVVCHGA